ncbi:serine/threonine-protein kinase [Roseimaritima ulvae]|uniref:Serine/threonine-protein kinase pkn6 n=1 Tax=Roseimaritima ulvae TaxID=980254 RepID=A0A5B9QSD2_9BACT|nr:serine/threonine-protein kinase [Roseimaritima ulvae]QEG39946.1 Serine/threonine-protein kinase pkn6 [Roseimaritima ulvae]
MLSTARHEPHATLSLHGTKRTMKDERLVGHYQTILQERKLNWTGHHHLLKLLGSGGQGEVFLTEHRGTDGFTLPLAMKFFSPERFEDARQYEESMQRIAGIAARVAQIQHDNMLDVQNFIERNNVRVMVMEWVDGYDLCQLTHPDCLDGLEAVVSAKRLQYIHNVITTYGQENLRFKAGIAVAIVRECLAALAALHREGILHGDVKPSNIMLKRTGHVKLIDIGSAIDYNDPPRERDCTPTYAAPELLEHHESTPRGDLASVGYVLIELLSGSNPFAGEYDIRTLLRLKRELPHQLEALLPDEVTRNELLMNFLQGLIAPDPNRRFSDAQVAEHQGAAAFQRQLILGNMATEYDNDIRLWLEDIRKLDFE